MADIRRSLDKSDCSFVAPQFVAEGINVALLNYALCPAVPIDHIVMQVLRALAWLHRNARRYGFDPARIVVVSGHSAGGHLAAMTACAHFDVLSDDLPRDLVLGHAVDQRAA
jgi:arylformamidase